MLAAVFGAASPGCVGLQLGSSKANDNAFSVPAEDGSRYVSVEGGALSTRQTIARRWKTAAYDACDGDYVVLSDAAFERRRLGVVERRIHEGFVSCVAGDQDQ